VLQNCQIKIYLQTLTHISCLRRVWRYQRGNHNP